MKVFISHSKSIRYYYCYSEKQWLQRREAGEARKEAVWSEVEQEEKRKAKRTNSISLNQLKVR